MRVSQNMIGVLIILFCISLLAERAEADVFPVVNTLDGGAGSLRQAIIDANANNGLDTIDATGVTGTIILLSALPAISEEVSIEGSGPTAVCGAGQTGGLCVSGGGLFRVFLTQQPNSTASSIKDLTITDGNISPRGGGIQVSFGDTLNLTNVRIKDCSSTNVAGGLYSETDSTVNITDSFIHNNHSEDGGGIGGVGILTITSTRITGNTYGRAGGGVWHGGTVTIRNSTISGNMATDASSSGGGIWTGGATLRIENSTISNGVARQGGGMQLNNSNSFMSNVTISGNTATNNGGGIYFNSGTHILRNVTFTSNDAMVQRGGGFEVAQGTVTIANVIVSQNTATLGGTAIANSGTVLTRGTNIINGTVFNNPVTVQTGSNITAVVPDLGPLAINGGDNETHALLPGSVGIDDGDNIEALNTDDPATPLTSDQRGAIYRRFVSGTVDIGAFEFGGHPRFDFDGDNKTDVSIFRPGPGEWWYLRSSDGGNNAFQFGSSTDITVPADFTGDGKTDVAIWRETTGEWFVLRSEDQSFFSFPFGTSGDIPAPGDYDGDGKDDPAVFRPAAATWFILRSSDSQVDFVPFGVNGDRPLVGDYDNDGKDDVAIYRPSVSQYWINRSNLGVVAFQFGQTGDQALTADFTGDGTSDVGFWRPGTGEWFVIRSEDQSFFAFPFGTTGDIPAPGDYDGDGTADATVFRPATNTWFSFQSTAGTVITGFGAAGDVPVPNSYVVD